nr:putative ribonuclease H-like domain-containing protein [Tanacetum cinerariifolium]
MSSKRIQHQTSIARTPKQNSVVERQNRTLVEAARTMLSAAKVPLFFWAKTMASDQNSSDPSPECQTMASDQNSSDPAPECQTMALNHDSLSPAIQHQEKVTQADHPLEQVIENPSQPVRTRRQLELDAEMCMFALT